MLRRAGHDLKNPHELNQWRCALGIELHPAPCVDLRDVEFGLRDLASALEGDVARLQRM